jgi:hypothetical protein
VIIQPSGKIVVAGNTHDNASGSFALARYLPTGQLDTTFGIAGTGWLNSLHQQVRIRPST